MASVLPNPNRLRTNLCAQILDYLLTEKLAEGSHLGTSALARRFNVSRTPVRAALLLLAERSILQNDQNRGFFLKKQLSKPSDIPADFRETSEERLYMAIANDRMNGELPDEVSEVELLRRYDTDRGTLIQVLHIFSQEGLAISKQGHGWILNTVLNSKDAYIESYNYRKIIEPAGINEITFLLDEEKASASRAEHEQLLEKSGVPVARIFQVNSNFHSMVAAFSGNRFIEEAVEQQNKLRRFAEYSFKWFDNPEVIQNVCKEHMAILDALENRNNQLAANLMWSHLDVASRIASRSTKDSVKS